MAHIPALPDPADGGANPFLHLEGLMFVKAEEMKQISAAK